jgi:HEAT repeat protein
LGKLGTEGQQAVPRLLRALDDKDDSVRDAAAHALGEIALALGDGGEFLWDETGRTLLKSLANDADPRVRRSAAYAVGCIKPRQANAITALRQALKDRQAMVRQLAAWALGRMGIQASPDALTDLCAMLDDPEPLVRREAANALGDLGQILAQGMPRKLLERFHKESDGNVRQALLDALVNLVGPEDHALAGELLALLDDDDADTVRAAALALGNLGGVEAAAAVPALRRALQDGDPAVTSLAAGALANIGPAAAPAIPELARALSDSDPKTRRNAALALGRIWEPADRSLQARLAPQVKLVVRPLIALLDPREPEKVRRYAIEALQSIGPLAEEAVPELLRVLQKDASVEVRVKSVMALGTQGIERIKAVPALEAVLLEKERATVLVRYNAAVVLGMELGERVNEKTLAVLQEALFDNGLLIYTGSSAKVTGAGAEAKGGDSEVTSNEEGDGREIIAKALASIGPRAARPRIIEGLEDAARSHSESVRKAADKALRAIKK